MKRRQAVWVLCVLFCLALPSRAHAGVIEWVDNLSGPGDFYGFTFEWRLVCMVEPVPAEETAKEEKIRTGAVGIIGPGCVFNRIPRTHRRVASVNLQFGLFWDKAKENRLSYADPDFDEKVRMTTVEPSFWVRPARWVEAGSGAGIAWFSGPGFESFRRVYLKPVQVDLKLLALVDRLKKKPDGSEKKPVREQGRVHRVQSGFHGISTRIRLRGLWSASWVQDRPGYRDKRGVCHRSRSLVRLTISEPSTRGLRDFTPVTVEVEHPCC